MSAGQGSIKTTLGGYAGVYCVHDRKKDEVTTEAQVAALGLDVGIVYDPKIHKLFRCTCCRNLFFDISDEPKYCHVCTVKPLVHKLGGPLPLPGGIVDG